MATSKSEICNLALNRLGSYASISDIDTPETDVEKTFARWYDQVRQKVLKSMIPSFATDRRYVSALADAPAFGFSSAYEYPNDCLRLLGIGNIEDSEMEYTVENKKIYTDYDTDDDGLPIRFITDFTDVTQFTVDFIDLFTWELAYAVCMPITQDFERLAYMEKILPNKRAEHGAIDSQENKPVRKNQSKFYKARTSDSPTNTEKK